MLRTRTYLLTLFCSALPLLPSLGCAALMEQWRTEHCTYDGAYQDGMNAAREGAAMDAERLARRCPAEAGPTVRDGYRRGYESGLANTARPSVVVVDAGHGAVATRQTVCKSTNDCASGFCRDRGDGLMLCMSNGARGDFCAWGTDCGSGLFCKSSGGVLKTCQ